MRVVFMGTPDFAVGTLEALVKAGHEVVLAVTQPDKPKGRGKAMQPTPVKEAAEAHGIPVYQPVKIRETSCVDYLRTFQPDVIVVVAFGQILPKSILEMPRYGCVNVHASLLPKYRGAAPIQWAVIDGEKETGVTTMRMDEGLDTGDMILKCVVPLDEKETGGSLFDKLSGAGADLLIETLRQLENGTAVFTKQDSSQSTYAGMIKKSLGQIDWRMEAARIECLIRGLNPWPSAYTKLGGKTLKIWSAEVTEEASAGHTPGAVVSVDGALFVAAGDRVLALTEVQLGGKKRMDTEAFLRGYEVLPGTVLGQEEA
ncbi:methionyl-tRNA formyltransferase [Oscillospiraceae bacterium Marseille-Q3528]|nr:methionyl-tRNA formyltransferase [Oscillospiraceae bacterium Marseille-Q3528]